MSNKVTTFAPPETTDEFISTWEPRIRAVARRILKKPVDVEDCTQTVLLALWSGKYVEAYDSSRGVSFEAYIFSQVRFRCLTYQRDLFRASQKEVTAQSIFEGESQEHLFAASDTRLDEIGNTITDSSLADALRLVYQELSQMPSTRTKNLARLFAEEIRQIGETGKVNVQNIGLILGQANGVSKGYSRQAISMQHRDLIQTKPMQALYQRLKAAQAVS